MLFPVLLHAQEYIPSLPSRGMPIRNRVNSGQIGGNIGTTTDSTMSNVDTSATKGLVFVKEEPDSVLRKKVFSFWYEPKSVKISEVFNPTLDPTGAQYHDPIDAMDGDYRLSTGVIGHPHISLFPRFATGLAPTLQADKHEGYAKTPDNIRLYQTLTPYSLLSYHSSLNKDYRLRLTHTQNILPPRQTTFRPTQDFRPQGASSSNATRWTRTAD